MSPQPPSIPSCYISRKSCTRIRRIRNTQKRHTCPQGPGRWHAGKAVRALVKPWRSQARAIANGGAVMHRPRRPRVGVLVVGLLRAFDWASTTGIAQQSFSTGSAPDRSCALLWRLSAAEVWLEQLLSARCGTSTSYCQRTVSGRRRRGS